MEWKLTKEGKMIVSSYIKDMKAKRKEILDARKDTADDTFLPDEEYIVTDLNYSVDLDEPEGFVYSSSWGVTDNYEADGPITLVLGQDFVIDFQS